MGVVLVVAAAARVAKNNVIPTLLLILADY
jgi:hypothetical protein